MGFPIPDAMIERAARKQHEIDMRDGVAPPAWSKCDFIYLQNAKEVIEAALNAPAPPSE